MPYGYWQIPYMIVNLNFYVGLNPRDIRFNAALAPGVEKVEIDKCKLCKYIH